MVVPVLPEAQPPDLSKLYIGKSLNLQGRSELLFGNIDRVDSYVSFGQSSKGGKDRRMQKENRYKNNIEK